MNEKSFRNTSIAFAVFVVVAGVASSNAVGDGADWAERFVAFSSASAPWIICATITWAAAQIIAVIRE